MKTNFTLLVILCCLPLFVHSQITRQEIDEKDKNTTIVYKVQGSSDLDILQQIDEDVEIGQEIQIAWEKPKQEQATPQKIRQPIPPLVEIPKATRKKTPETISTSTTTTSKSLKVVAMSKKKRRKKKAFKAFPKGTKKQRRKKQNKKKCYTF